LPKNIRKNSGTVFRDFSVSEDFRDLKTADIPVSVFRICSLTPETVLQEISFPLTKIMKE